LGSLITLLLAAGFAAAQAPAPPGGTAPAEPAPPTPAQQPGPDPAADNPPTLFPGPPPGVDPRSTWEPAPYGDPPLAGPPGRFYLSAEYLRWWTNGQRLPLLVTTGSTSDTPPGAFGQPSTVEIIGDLSVDTQTRSGGRFTGGLWLDDAQTIGLEGGAFFLEPHSTHLVAFGNGLNLLARPFFAVGTVTAPDGTQQELAQEDALIVGSPGVSTGQVHVSTTNRFWGAEANARVNLCGDCFYRFDLLAGFRYLELKDALGVVSQSDTIPPSGPTTVTDNFSTLNRFYGGQVGALASFQHGRWFVDFRGKLALGGIRRAVIIDGSTAFTTSSGTTVLPGGLFAQPTNMGLHTSWNFSVVPEVGAQAGCQITHFLRASVGYSLIYLARNVAQPGDQIDRAVNVNQVPALGQLAPLASDFRPVVTFQNSYFWAQGFTAGLEINF
jgi:hypothetical protein